MYDFCWAKWNDFNETEKINYRFSLDVTTEKPNCFLLTAENELIVFS